MFYQNNEKKKFFEVKFWKILGRLVGAGGYWVREATGCGRLVGAGG